MHAVARRAERGNKKKKKQRTPARLTQRCCVARRGAQQRERVRHKKERGPRRGYRGRVARRWRGSLAEPALRSAVALLRGCARSAACHPQQPRDEPRPRRRRLAVSTQRRSGAGYSHDHDHDHDHDHALIKGLTWRKQPSSGTGVCVLARVGNNERRASESESSHSQRPTHSRSKEGRAARW